MHIAICDDNNDELSRIMTMLEDYSREHKGSITYEAFSNALDLIERMKLKSFDLLILDILMPGITGIDIAKELRDSGCEIPIIFLTSSREYAVESYRVGAEDYIMKPARRDEIFPSIDKQLARFTKEASYLTLKTANGILRLPFSQIVYVEVVNRKLLFMLVNGEVREAYGYLTDYEGALISDSHFYKPHRSYVVNLRHITELNKTGFVTMLGTTVPIARDAFAKAKAAYMSFLRAPSDRR